MDESRFLFVLDIIVQNLLDEGRRTYSLCRMCVLSLIILLALRSTCFSYKAVTEVCLRPVILLLIFTTRCNLFMSFWLRFNSCLSGYVSIYSCLSENVANM